MTRRRLFKVVMRWFDSLDLEVKIVLSILIPISILFFIVIFDLFYRWAIITTGGVIFLLFDKVQSLFQGVL